MELRALAIDAATDWPDFVARCGGGPLHLPALHLADQDASELLLLRFEAEGVQGCALGIAPQAHRLKRIFGGARTLVLPSAPACSDPNRLPELRDALVAFARERGFRQLRVQPSSSSPLFSPDYPGLRATGSIVEFLLDLRRAIESIQAGYHKQHRKNVRRAERQELLVREESDLEGLLRLREMQLSSSHRAEERAEGFGVPEAEVFERLHEHVYGPGIGHVLFAWHGGTAIAALAWVAAAGRVLTVRSGSLALGYELRAMYLLYDTLIQRAVQEGCFELNAGGVPAAAVEATHPQAGLYEFKHGFGTVPIERHGIELDLAG